MVILERRSFCRVFYLRKNTEMNRVWWFVWIVFLIVRYVQMELHCWKLQFLYCPIHQRHEWVFWARYLLSGPNQWNGVWGKVLCSKTSTYTALWVACDAHPHTVSWERNANSNENFSSPTRVIYGVYSLIFKKCDQIEASSEPLFLIAYILWYYQPKL